ncbi:MAG: hypothetical protein LH609_20310 [Rudanella sp.]|nr:hypothetical protein [Rudanella sp.]
MKKLFILLIGTIAFFISGAFTSLNQIFVWDHYKIQLTVPDDFTIVKNTDDEFAMNGDGMELTMELFEQNITIDELDEAVKKGADAMKLEALDEEHELDMNGLEGYYVEGMLKGNRVMFAGLMDSQSHTNFFLALTFDDTDKTAEADALRILSSIKHAR